MSTKKWVVVKRNGEAEPYADGRIALAVFRATQAQRPPFPASEARGLASSVAAAMLIRLRSSSEVRFEVEHIQDGVVAIIRELGRDALADSYQAYREERQSERGRLGVARRVEKGFRFVLPGGPSLDITREAWAKVLTASLARGAGSEWDVSSWWGSVKGLAVDAKTFDDFVGLHLRVLLERSNGRQAWLGTASALLLERWSARILGSSPLLHGKSETAKALKAHFKAHWARRRATQSAPWFPPARELDAVARGLAPELDPSLCFAGLALLEKTFGHGPEGLMPQEVFANSAIALSYSLPTKDGAETSREADCNFLIQSFVAGRLIPPLNLMRQARMAAPILGQEAHLHLGDSMESIFEALSAAAAAGKSGLAVSVDLSNLRAEGSPVGRDGQASGGIAPVMRLFGEACSMLKGRNGEKQKARLSLACWHRDLDSFLAYGKAAPKEMRFSVGLPDAFMRRVFEGGDWVLASPSEAPHLAGAKGGDFERWVREYAQMAKFGGLEQARCVPARQVFGWITECIASSGGPSVVFSDACVHYARPAEPSWPSSRMAGVACRGGRVDFIELGMPLRGTPEEISELMSQAHGVLSRRAAGSGGAWQASVAPVGQPDIESFVRIVALANEKLAKLDGVLPKGALWSMSNPWESRWKWIEQSRGGYLERDESLAAEPEVRGRTSGPPTMISLSTREEYLWLSDSNPIFVNHDHYRRQVWFEGVRVGFGGSGDYEPLKRQIKRASEWQSWSDGALALDVRLDGEGSAEVGEAIKLAWLHGLVGVRRFVGRRVVSTG